MSRPLSLLPLCPPAGLLLPLHMTNMSWTAQLLLAPLATPAAVRCSGQYASSQTAGCLRVALVVPVPCRPTLQVTILPDWLTVELKWYGRVADGPLHRRAKASEAQWCMEDNEVRGRGGRGPLRPGRSARLPPSCFCVECSSARLICLIQRASPAAASTWAASQRGFQTCTTTLESRAGKKSPLLFQVHVILPKDDRSYWKALFEGGEEKGYVELLKEAVHAGAAGRGGTASIGACAGAHSLGSAHAAGRAIFTSFAAPAK